MSRTRRRMTRTQNCREYRKIFVIAAEGRKTEPQYFNIFNNKYTMVQVTLLKHKNKSAPHYVLKQMREYLKKAELRASDQAWLVVDTDRWPREQLQQLHQWSLEQPNHGLAVSNPHFEYWILLHFEEGQNVHSPKECSKRLERYLPDYDKAIDSRKISPERIAAALKRAQKKDTPPCKDWPHRTGSTVYRLVAHIVQAGEKTGVSAPRAHEPKVQ